MVQLKNALQPAISNVNISWEGALPEFKGTSKYQETRKKDLLKETNLTEKEKNLDLKTKQIPSRIPPIYDGTRLLAYYFYSPESNKPTSINITANSPTGPLAINILIDEINILSEGNIVRKLAARRKIQELEESITVDSIRGWSSYEHIENEDRYEIKKRIVELGLENNLASQYTSFVGIDHTTGDILSDKPICTREIKNQLASDFIDVATSMNDLSDLIPQADVDLSMWTMVCENSESIPQCLTLSTSNRFENSKSPMKRMKSLLRQFSSSSSIRCQNYIPVSNYLLHHTFCRNLY